MLEIFVRKQADVLTSLRNTFKQPPVIKTIEMKANCLNGERVGGRNVIFAARSYMTPARRQTFSNLRTNGRKNNKVAVNHAGITKSLCFLSKHAFKPMRVSDLARAATMSLRGFNKAFTKHAGESPGRRLRRHRLNHARRLLLGSTRGLAAIAQRCGYRSVNSFCVAFKRDIGISPMRFRHKLAHKPAWPTEMSANPKPRFANRPAARNGSNRMI